MGYEAEVLHRARERYTQDVAQYRAEQRARQREIYENLPETLELENQIRGTMAEVIALSLRHGTDPTAKLRETRGRNLALQEELTELLLENDYPADALDLAPRCSLCGDRGYVGDKMCDCFRAYCQEEQRKELTSLLTGRNSFDDFSLDYYPETVNPATGLSPRAQMEMVYETCLNYASHFRPGPGKDLLFNGAPGLGKTLLSACIAREVVDRGYSVVYDTAIHLFSCMENQKFGRASEEESRTCQRILQCDLLILDDLGTEMLNHFIPAALYSLINSRGLSEKPTIISTNLTMAQMAQRYSPQIASRLEGAYRVLNFVGNDIRKLTRKF